MCTGPSCRWWVITTRTAWRWPWTRPSRTSVRYSTSPWRRWTGRASFWGLSAHSTEMSVLWCIINVLTEHLKWHPMLWTSNALTNVGNYVHFVTLNVAYVGSQQLYKQFSPLICPNDVVCYVNYVNYHLLSGHTSLQELRQMGCRYVNYNL